MTGLGTVLPAGSLVTNEEEIVCLQQKLTDEPKKEGPC